MSVEGKLRLAVQAAFFVGAASGSTLMPSLASAQESAAAPDKKGDEGVELDKVQVTGSRLTRAAVEGALPVSVIDRKDIETSGFTSLGELLRNTVFNSTGALRAQSGSSAQSLVSVDLRGLGSERTLVLIDGRRAPKAPFLPSAQDLNAVPLAAVERIEILKDGASAVYGSDAIGGVINIITRKDFEGVEIDHQRQWTARKGGDTEQGSVTMGINGSRGNIVFGANYFNRDIIFSRDSLFNVPGTSFFSNNLIILRDTDRNGVFNPDDESPDYGGDEYLYAAVPGGCPNTDPAFQLTSSGLCGYDFTLVAADEAETQNQGLFAKGTFHISDTWDLTVNGSINRAKSFGRYAPGLNDTALTIPTDNPFYQTEDIVQLGGNNGGTAGVIGVDEEEIFETLLYHRFASLGNRDTSTDANVYDISGIFSGQIDIGPLGQLELNAGARYNEYKYYEFGRFFLLRPAAQGGLDDGSYDFRDPNATPEAAASFKATTARESTWITREAFTDVQIPLFTMSGGQARLAVGFEYREEDYSDLYDAASEGGQIGGSAGNSSGLDRRVRAYFSEALFPVLNNLELTAALRYDDYSDFGSATSPKVGLRYQPIDALTLRASWGEGFRAPTLDVLSAKDAFSAEPVSNDQPTCELLAPPGSFFDLTTNTCFDEDGNVVEAQINATQIANPDLTAEDSKQYSVGFAYDVTRWFDFSLDYYNIEIDNLIREFTPADVIDAVRDGETMPEPEFGIERGPTGRITDLVFGTTNEGTLKTNGLDLEANLRFNLGGLGHISSQLRYVYMLEYHLRGRDQAGEPTIPDTRIQGATAWKISSFGFGWNFNLIGDQAETISKQPGVGFVRGGHIPTYVTHDFQATYTAPWNGTITAGVLNVFDKEPDPRSAFDGRQYNFFLYDQYGQQPYIRYTQRF